jgi:hypothetical protein
MDRDEIITCLLKLLDIILILIYRITFKKVIYNNNTQNHLQFKKHYHTNACITS